LSYEPEKDFKTVRSSQLKRNRNLDICTAIPQLFRNSVPESY